MKINDINLLVNMPFYVNTERMPITNQVIQNCLAIQCNRVEIILDINYDASDDMISLIHKDPRVKLVKAPYLENPLMLAWESKKHLKNFLESDFTHTVYMEDDMDFKQHHLEYWLENRSLFDGTRYIPGFVRFEYNNQGEICLTDWLHQQRLDSTITVGDRQFFSPIYPYHAMYIMDQDLAAEHLSSPVSHASSIPHGWGEREYCNEAYYYYNPPSFVPISANGLKHRILLPVPDITPCLIHHMTDKFSRLEGQPHGKLRLIDLFI